MAPSQRSRPTRRTGLGLRLSREAIDDARVRRLDIAHLSHIVMNGWSYLTVHITGASSPQLNKSTYPDPCAQRGCRSPGTIIVQNTPPTQAVISALLLQPFPVWKASIRSMVSPRPDTPNEPQTPGGQAA
jgi:hypothetical protein